MLITLDRPNEHTGTTLVWWIHPEQFLDRQLMLFGLRIPFMWFKRKAKYIRPGEYLGVGRVMKVEFE